MSEFYSGFDDLESIIKEYSEKANDEKVMEVLEIGAKEFVQLLLKLPSPKSKIRKTGYTHLVATFTYKQNKKQIVAGWGKYYGPMVENGTKLTSAHAHLNPTWKKNSNAIYKKMIENFERR